MRNILVIAVFVLLIVSLAWAQNNSKTNNIVVNGSFEEGATGFESEYKYSARDVRSEGTYSVSTSPNFVHSSFEDFTTRWGKKMMIVNGGTGDETVVWRQKANVEKTGKYAFSVQAASVYAANGAVIALFVNNQEVRTKRLSISKLGVWEEIKGDWESNASVAILEIRLLSTETHGNDFALDEIVFN